MSVATQSKPVADPEAILSKAALRAAAALGISNKEFAAIVGVSPAYVTKLKAGTASFALGSKPAELATHFIRSYRSLDAIVGGEGDTARIWMRMHNTALGDVPVHLMKTIAGLLDVEAYLDQRRAPL